MNWTRRALVFVLMAALLPSCVTKPRKAKTPPRPKTAGPIITPDLRPVGRVELVNTVGRFVVVSFASGQLPELNKRLGVYHNGQKTAEVKLTGPQRDINIIAEITAGAPQVQDEVKAD